jgi:hypothetical protein
MSKTLSANAEPGSGTGGAERVEQISRSRALGSGQISFLLALAPLLLGFVLSLHAE